MEENEPTVAGSQQGQGQTKTNGSHGQTHGHKPIGEEPPEHIHDDRVFRFRTGIRPY